MVSNKTIITISILLISLIIGSKYVSILLKSYSTKDDYDFKPRTRSLTEKSNKNYDLVIVGTGLSGLTSAYQAYLLSKNIDILILETESIYGGESIKDIDGINFFNTPIQKKENIYDNFKSYYDDTNNYGRKFGNPELIEVLLNNSNDLYNFYTNELKADLSNLILTEGNTIKRTHKANNNETTGYYLINLLYEKLAQIPNIKFVFNANVIDLLTLNNDNETITGLIYETESENNLQTINHTVITKSIILATGGYGHDFYTEDSLLKENLPHLYYYPTLNDQHIKGSGIKMARNIGADLDGMRHVELYPTCFVNNFDRFNRKKIMAPLELLKFGILIHQRGKRFINELTNRRSLAQNIIKHCDTEADPSIIKQYESYLIINEKFIDDYENLIKPFEKKYLNKYSSLKEFTEYYGKKEYYKNLERVINEYNTKNTYDKYGRVNRTYFDINDPVYVGIVTPCIFHTLGGLKINKNSEVFMKEKTEIIKGLFAAGEIIGSVHGDNVLPGNALTQCGVFGRIAAKSAIKYIKSIKY